MNIQKLNVKEKYIAALDTYILVQIVPELARLEEVCTTTKNEKLINPIQFSLSGDLVYARN